MNARTKIFLSLLGGVLLMVPLYIILHEGGHSLAAVLCGAKITKFSILGAHMSYEGGAFTPVTLSLFHAMGMLFPILISALYMLFYRKEAANIPYRIFSFFFSIVCTFPVVAWIVIPVLYSFNAAPLGDDVTNFMDSSGLNPWVVSLGACLLFSFIIFIIWKKRIIQNYWFTVKLANKPNA